MPVQDFQLLATRTDKIQNAAHFCVITFILDPRFGVWVKILSYGYESTHYFD